MFDIYATLLIPFIILFFGIIGYFIKDILPSIKLNSYTVGLISYFALFEIISIPLIFLHISFNIYFIIMLIVTFTLLLASAYKYIYNYRINKINHKYQLLRRYWDSKYIYNITIIFMILLIVLFNIFPFSRLRDDELHWLINVKDNIVHNNLLSIYSENGTYIKFSEIYSFNALTLFFSFIVKLTNVDIIAFSLITLRTLWIFSLLFMAKDLFHYLSKSKAKRNWSYTSFIIFTIIWTNTNTFYELPFTLVFPVVGQRLVILMLFPIIQMCNHSIKEGITKDDYIFHILIAFAVMFFATSSYFIVMPVYIFYILGALYLKKKKIIIPIIISILIMTIVVAMTMYVYKITGPAKTVLGEYLNKIRPYDHKNAFTVLHSKWSSWITFFTNVPLFKFIVPISFVLWSKTIEREYKLLATLFIFTSIIANPITYWLFGWFIPQNIFARLNNYYTFIGYILLYPMIHELYLKVRTKSDFIKIWQLFIILYVALGFIDVNNIVKRNVNIINVHWDGLWSAYDWDKDDKYPIDKYQKQVYDHIADDSNKKHYVASTSYLMTNYRLRMFDSDAIMITPRTRFHQSFNYKNEIHECLNTSNYLSKKNINLCNKAVEYYKNTYVITSNANTNNFTQQLDKKFKQYYKNKRFIVYKRNNNE